MRVKEGTSNIKSTSSPYTNIGNQAMLRSICPNNHQVIQMHSYTDKQLEIYVTQLFHDGKITEEQAIDYFESIYDRNGMSDAQVMELGLNIHIRAECYPTYFNAEVMQWKADQMDQSNQFYCIDCDEWHDASKATIDHKISVSHHWNTVGYNSSWDDRYTFYNYIPNLQLLCRPCNSRKGGENYISMPGPQYSNE